MTDIPADDRHIDPERDQFDAFKALPRNEAVAMLNMLRFKDKAAYPQDHPDAGKGWTGAEAYAAYGRDSEAVFRRVGGTIAWRGVMQTMVTGPKANWWDLIFIANYPTAGAFLEMVTDPVYREAVKHRQAAVFTSRLIRCQAQAEGRGFG
jgi:uncharacterized protein (DUF1330 family)